MRGAGDRSASLKGPSCAIVWAPSSHTSMLSIQGAPTGPLADLTFAAKDLFDVRGTVTGNPDWEATHPPATRSACSASTASSARRCTPGRPIWCPAASSSGSASAVAGGLDTALGTDPGGSVRIPSSFCGLYGLRPTHGGISVAGMATQSPSFDTVGFFARDAGHLLPRRHGAAANPSRAHAANGTVDRH